MTTAIRHATEDDVDAVAAVHVEAWRAAYEGVFPDAAIAGDLERRREAWHRYIQQPASSGQRLLVVTSAGEIVGFGAFGPSRDDDAEAREVGEIYAMYLEPKVWRQGVGRRLLAEVERGLVDDGFTEATLWVLAANARARAFYEAAGWVADGAEKRERLHSIEVVEVRYRRPVAGPRAPSLASERRRTGFVTTGSRTVYENRWMRVREDEIERPDGSAGLYGVVEKPDFVVVIPLDADGVWLVEQLRYPVGRRFWELPQGSWEDSPEADPAKAARGELAEETGLRAGRIERLGHLWQAYGYSTQGFEVFLATELEQGERSPSIEEQEMAVRRVAVEDFETMMRQGEIGDASTLAAWTLLRLKAPAALPPRRP